jgi:hypothetical protein
VAGNPLDTTGTVLAERSLTLGPLQVGGAATPTVAVPGTSTPAPAPACDPTVVDVTRLPAVMDAHSFPQGAALLRKWLSLPAAVNPRFAATDTTTVTMDFVLGFPRARKQFDRIFSEKLYLTAKVQRQISTLVKRLGVGSGGSFGFARPVEQLDPGPEPVQSFDVTTVAVGSLADPLDALTAALGRFAFKVVVAGHVDKDPATGQMRVTLTDVGVHVEDRFDFEGWQLLGCWNVCTNEIGRVTCGGVLYENRDFRDWRAKTGRGGDIWVLSDVRSVKLDPVASFPLL